MRKRYRVIEDDCIGSDRHHWEYFGKIRVCRYCSLALRKYGVKPIEDYEQILKLSTIGGK